MNGCGEVGFDPTSALLPPGRVGFCWGRGGGLAAHAGGRVARAATALIPPLLGTALLLAGDITREPTPCLLSVSPSRSLIHRQRWQDQGLCESQSWRQQHACGV